MINQIRKIIAIKTIANDKKSNVEGIKFITDLLEEIGFDCSIEGDSKYSQPVIVAKYLNSKSNKKVTLYGHYDVEKINNEASWNTDPFSLVEHNSRYYARGIADNKGILICRIYALLEMKKNKEELPNILWIIQGEEEVAGETPFQIIPKHIQAFNSKIYVEETGIHDKNNTPVIFYLSKESEIDPLINRLNTVIYRGKAIIKNRHLNKFTKCPFVTNIPSDGIYIGFGPNDNQCSIHRPNESLNVKNLHEHKNVFKKFINWINNSE